MKKIYIILGFIIFIVFCIWIYYFNKPHYLNLAFTNTTNTIEITKIEVATIKDVGNSNLVLNKGSIEKIIKYLNSIPLKYIGEGENFDNTGGLTIIFYDDNELCVGWLAINKQGYIHNSRNVTTYKPYDKSLNIIHELENLEDEGT